MMTEARRMSELRAEEPSVVLWWMGSEAYENDMASRWCREAWMNSSVPDHQRCTREVLVGHLPRLLKVILI